MYAVDTVELKKIMVEKGLDKIVDLSNASAVDRNTLSKVLSGETKPSTTVIEKLLVALDIPSEKAGPIFLIRTYVIRKKNCFDVYYLESILWILQRNIRKKQDKEVA